MNDAMDLTLDRANRRVLARLQALEDRLGTGDDDVWAAYLTTVQTLVLLARNRQPGKLLTTRELAERLNVDERTVRRHHKAGALTPALARGRVIRWAADSVPRGTAPGTALRGTANDARGSSLSRAVPGGRRR